MAAVIQEAYIQGVSTGSVDEFVKSLGMMGAARWTFCAARSPTSSLTYRRSGRVQMKLHVVF